MSLTSEEALHESKEQTEKVINRRSSTNSCGNKKVLVDEATEKDTVLDVAETMEDDVSGTADCTVVTEENLEIRQQEGLLTESMTFSASLLEKISLLQTKLGLSNEINKVADEQYGTLKKSLNELSEFARCEKELRDVGIFEEQLESMSCNTIEATNPEQNEALMEKIHCQEQQLDHALLELNRLKSKLEEQASLVIDTQTDMLELQDEAVNLKTQLEERDKLILELEQQLNQMANSAKDAAFNDSSVDCGVAVNDDIAVKKNTGTTALLDERQAFVELQKKHEKVTTELKAARDQLLLCNNKDLDVQKCRNSLEHLIKDMNYAEAQSNQKNKVLVNELNNDLTQQKEAFQKELETEKKEKLEAVELLEKLKSDERLREKEVSDIKQQIVLLLEVMRKEAKEDFKRNTSAIEQVRKEKTMRWTAILEAKVEEIEREAEEMRIEELLTIKQQTMETLQQILVNTEADNKQMIEDIQKQHASEIKRRLSEELRQLDDKYQTDIANLKADNEKLKLSTNCHAEDVEELHHRFEHDLQEKDSELSDMEVILTKKEIEIGELEQQLKDIRLEMERSRQQCSQRKPDYDAVATALRLQLDTLKAEQQTQIATKTRELECAHANQMESLQRQHQEQLAEISAEHQSWLKGFVARHSAEVDDDEAQMMKRTNKSLKYRLTLSEQIIDSLRREQIKLKTALNDQSRKLLKLRVQFDV